MTESCFQINSLQYLGMKNPIFRGVNPWFFIFRSMDNHATICDAVQPGLTLTKLRISSRSRRSLASFCDPLAMVSRCLRRYMRKYMGTPGGPNSELSLQRQHDLPTGFGEFLRFRARSSVLGLVRQCTMHPMNTEFDASFNHAVSLSQL